MGTVEIILGVISTIIITLGANWIKELFNFRKYKAQINESEKRQDGKLVERDKKLINLIVDRLEGIENKQVANEHKFDDLNKLLKSHIEENNFREKFKDAIQDASRQVMMLTQEFLDQDYKNMLAHWADNMKKFGLDFYYSNKRKESKKNREKWINEELKVHINNFYNFVNFHKGGVRVFEKKKVLFADFLKKAGLHGKTEILKLDLVRNGFKHNQDVIDRFTEHIDDFIKDFIGCVITWRKLELIVDKQISA